MIATSHCMLVTSAAAAFFDLLEGKIPNPLTLAAVCTSFCFRAAGPMCGAVFLKSPPLREAVSSAASWAGGLAVPLLLLPFFYFRLIGAGDIKLLAALGSFLSPSGSFSLLAGSLIAGILFSIFRFLLMVLKDRRSVSVSGSFLKMKIPFAVPVFGAVLLVAGGII